MAQLVLGVFRLGAPHVIESATFYPEPGVDDVVDDALRAGARVFKVHVQVGRFSPLDPRLEAVWDVLAKARTPVIIHCGNGPHRGEHTGAGPIRELVTQHPRLVLVVAHAGLPDYLDFLDIARDHPNVYLDTTMVGTSFMEKIAPLPSGYPQLLSDLTHQIVLGSDFPSIPHPYSHQLQALSDWNLGDTWLRDAMWDTPVSLLRDTGTFEGAPRPPWTIPR